MAQAPRGGKGGRGAVSMEEGDGVKQRRDEVGGDRESELKPVGLPAVRKREEGQRQLVQGAEGREQSRVWGMEALRADQGWRFGRDGVDGKRQRGRKPAEQVGTQLERRTQRAEALAGRKEREVSEGGGEHEEEGQRRHWKGKQKRTESVGGREDRKKWATVQHKVGLGHGVALHGPERAL